MTITIDGSARQVPTLAFSAAIGQREGSFVLAPKAVIDDGLFDYLHVGALRRWELIRQFPGMLTGDLPKDHPKIWMGRCRYIHVRAEVPLIVHLDGELFSWPKDGLRDLEIRILPGALPISRRCIDIRKP
jgi:diacylglycerol kinase family enzyme